MRAESEAPARLNRDQTPELTGTFASNLRHIALQVSNVRWAPLGEYDLGPAAELVLAWKEMALCLSTQWRSRSRRTAPRMRR